MKNIFLKDSRWGTTLNNTNSYNDHSFLEHYTPAIIIMKLSISQNKYKVQFLSDIAIKIIYCSSTGRRWPLCHFISVKFNKHSYNFPTIPGSWDCSFFPHHNDVGQFVHHHIECVHHINCFGSDLINWSGQFQDFIIIISWTKTNITKASVLITNEAW